MFSKPTLFGIRHYGDNSSDSSGEVYVQPDTQDGLWNLYWTVDVGDFDMLILASSRFKMGTRHPWLLELYPRGGPHGCDYGCNPDFLSIYLCCVMCTHPRDPDYKDYTDNGLSVLPLHYTFAVLQQDKCQIHQFLKTNIKSAYNFRKEGMVRGFDHFIKLNHLLNPENGFVVKGQVTFVLQVIIVTELIADHFCELGCNNDNSDFGRFFNSKTFSDCSVSVGGRKYYSHKIILSANSPVLAKMFEHPMKENITSNLEIAGDSDAVEQVLKYMYSRKYFKASKITPLYPDILPLSDMYELNLLKFNTGKALISEIDVHNVCDLLIASDLYRVELLKTAAIKFIHTHRKEVYTTDGWKNLVKRPDLLTEISENEEMAFYFNIDDVLNPDDLDLTRCTVDHHFHTDELYLNFAEFFNNEIYSDFSISLYDRKYYLHKIVLCGNSPVFNRMFNNPMEENTPTNLEITKCSPDAVEEFLQYMYTGKCSLIMDMTLEVALDILRLSHIYELHNLKTRVKKALFFKMNIDSVCDILVGAYLCSAELLKSAALAFINNFEKEVMATDGWINVMKHSDLSSELFEKKYNQYFICKNIIQLKTLVYVNQQR